MLKNRKKLGSAVDIDLYMKLKKLSSKTKINQSRLLDEALEDLFKKYSKKIDL